MTLRTNALIINETLVSTTARMHFLLFFVLIAFYPRSGTSRRHESKQAVEFTESYIPAGLQVLSHYISQLQELPADTDRSEGSRSNMDIEKQGWYEKPPQAANSPGRSTKKSESRMRTLVTSLSREAKRQDLGKYQGFSSEVISELEKTSKMTSGNQLSFVLHKIHTGEIRKVDVRSQIGDLLRDLGDDRSDMSKDLEMVKPLQYLS